MKSVYAVLNTDWVGPEAGQVFQRPRISPFSISVAADPTDDPSKDFLTSQDHFLLPNVETTRNLL